MDRSAELESFVRRMYELMKAGDHASFSAFVPEEEGILFVGTDSDEWWDSPAAIRAAARDQLQATGGFPFEDEDPHGYVNGDIGWFCDRPSMRMGEDMVVPMRMTGVARKVNGNWQLLQAHLSVGANANEQLFE